MLKSNFILYILVGVTGYTSFGQNNITIEKKSKIITFNAQETFTLNAHLENLEAEYLVYTEKDDSRPDGFRRDTLWVKDEKFTFKDTVSDYKLYYITIPEALRSYKVTLGGKVYRASVKAKMCRMWFIGYPGAEITYSGKVDDFMVNAYPSDQHGINDDLGKINKQIFPLINKTDSIIVTLSTNKNLSAGEVQKMNKERSELDDKVKEMKVSFIKTHPKSIAASYIFSDAYYRNSFTYEQAKELFDRFDAAILTGTPFYEEVKSRLEAVEKTGIGMQAPEFITKNTDDGSEFRLSDLKGNYVLIDYWGTWCGPCMGEMPKIKEYYNKYSDKNFMVLGINSGDTSDRWKEVIKEREYNWRHIQTTRDHNLLIPFNVNSFPTKILLDPAGKIIYSSKNSEKADMYKMLDSIFSKS
ncbi:AhpC/TSA family protein [Zhouia spongiae]|uniref:AhpC/TSA family protein n=1 Tax=Zhouia spongiae TaxID=2202721 RepID=A0ABY3YLS9_9FLAO|nr:TlpA disulfide reductase family protein [Zhouia spongiae]UNY98559.1 AhpC/TSA family protein [Zhouia spongiae]